MVLFIYILFIYKWTHSQEGSPAQDRLPLRQVDATPAVQPDQFVPRHPVTLQPSTAIQ